MLNRGADHYATLGLPPTASAAEIEAAYQRLAAAYHPGLLRSPGEAAPFLAVQAAHAVLSDPARRAAYDRAATAAFDQFADTFYGAGARLRARADRLAGSHLEVVLRLSAREAAAGGERVVAVERLEACDRCGGWRAEPGGARAPCPACGGRGEAWAAATRPGGRVIEISRCEACDGFGEEIGVPCGACGGVGRRSATVPVAVRVPVGADATTRLRLAEQGDAGRGDGRRGDLVVRVEVTPDGAP